MRLKNEDIVIGMDVVEGGGGHLEFLTVGENGVGKRTGLAEYKTQGRGGSGIKTAEVTAKTGKLIYAKVINKEDTDERDLMMISAKGQVIRLPFKSINSSGRATQGVRLMRFKEEGDRVASVTII